MQTQRIKFKSVLAALLFLVASASAQTSVFTYQGKLTSGGSAANGTFEMQFRLYDADGTAIGSAVTNASVTVTQGIFTVQLNFGAGMFDGADRFLEIGVRPSGSTNAFTLLAPRQQIKSAPYAIRSLSALNADTATNAANSQQLGGVAANQFVQTTDARLSDARNPTVGSANYIQNTTTPQTSANFNIGGTGTANIVNAQTQYNIGGNRVLSVRGSANIFAGVSAGNANTTGAANSFFGTFAGQSNTTGDLNSYVGYGAGENNTTGGANSFFGYTAGFNNTIGEYNSFVGRLTGFDNTTGTYNSFVGASAGSNNTTGSYNTMLGYNAKPNVNNLDHATAIGADSVVYTSNTVVLGRSGGQDFVRVPGLLQIGNIGLPALTAKLVVTGSGAYNAATAPRFDLLNTAFGGGFLQNVTDSGLFQIATINGGLTRLVIDGTGNVGIGTANPATRLAINGGTAWTSNGWTGSLSMPNLSALGWEANASGQRFGIGQSTGGLYFFRTNSAFGTTTNPANYDLTITDGGDVGIGTTSPQAKLHVNGDFRVASAATVGGTLTADYVVASLNMKVGQLIPGGSDSTPVCRYSSNNAANGYFSFCSSSLRYKTDVRDYRGGLNFIKQLRPISYKWKSNDAADVGFGAEDVAKINPLFVTYNDKGEVEGVKYDRLSVAFVNAFKEQQEQIERQNQQIKLQNQQIQQQRKKSEQQQQQIDGLRKIFCGLHPKAKICR